MEEKLVKLLDLENVTTDYDESIESTPSVVTFKCELGRNKNTVVGYSVSKRR